MGNGFETGPDLTPEESVPKDLRESSPEILVSKLDNKKPKLGVLKKIQISISRIFTAKL